MSTAIAFIAHDTQKSALVTLIQKYRAALAHYHLIATEVTAQWIQEESGLAVERLASGKMGGDLQIAARVVSGEVAGVVFLIDPLQAKPHEPSLQAILRACAIHNVPLATNLATAELVARGVAKNQVAYLIFNPVAGQGNPDQDLALIRQILEPQVQLHTIFTTAELDPAEQAREAIAAIQAHQTEDETGFIIASGGDGTVSAIASSTIETGIPLGVIPRGTANAFSNALGIPTNLKAACETIAAGHTRKVDAARCNDIPMILLAGVGLEAGMVDKANRDLKNRLGPLAYILSGAQQLFDQEPFKVTLEMDGEAIELQTSALTVANAAPPTSVMAQGFGEVIPDDGLLEVTIATSEDKLQVINAIASLFASGLVKSQVQREDIVCLRTQQLKITTDPPQKLVVDGEILTANPVTFDCIPNGLTIFTPIGTD